ncbi:peroxisomal d3,d2-enoyl-CoA isomeras-like protein [Rhizodiscina lignyota]|uniref:Peroxisomal d3,d2-enoyl-CoA isomeras-like protein n=1 Tax=Rhizodiscina lignyota TaxID=1504668 RepID=A0A9P4IFA5_9PEZI|nr:peroxisomal d3,d2-enoyl-CoA isomeras-like protein [Rhizodiscina lignyota]
MSASEESQRLVTLEKRGKIAIITMNRADKLNAMNQDLYFRLAALLRDVAEMPDIYITILTGKGRYFSAGADVTSSRHAPPGEDPRRIFMRNFVSNNLHLTHAFYTHPKILITAMNGPAVGLSAAMIAHSDFIYAAPHSFLLTPFSSLGLVSEGNASVAFVERLGISKANEALIMSKRISAEELLHVNFVNKIIDVGNPKAADYSDKFMAEVLKEVDNRLGDHLNSSSMVKTKELIRRPMRAVMDAQGVHEVFGGMERFLSGVPQEEFRKIASGEKKHKL